MKKYVLKPFACRSCRIDYQKQLNPQQYKVVTDADGACLVLAGAGSGKTRVLTYRLAYLVENGIHPNNIMLVTFTNKAAREMISRAESLLKMSLANLWMGTFHHIGNIVLRKEAGSIGYSTNFTIIDREDSKDVIEDCLEELGYLKKEKLFPKKDIVSRIKSLASNSQKKIEEVISRFYPHIEEYTSSIKKVLSLYKEKKKSANIMDFDDLLINWLEVLRSSTICKKYSQVFKYILVDEYQDTNRIQFEILKLLCSVHKNILVVGDDAQSIYSFRAADINNLLDFPRIFPETKIFKLETNYRSSPQILSLANEIIRHNINQFPKTLRAIKQDGPLPLVVETKDVYQQAKFVAQQVLELSREGIRLENIAVLFRSRFQAIELEVELLKRNIPYVIRGGLRFFEQAHIKDILSYLKILINPKDELSFKRALCLHRGIGRTYAHQIWEKYRTLKESREIARKLPRRQKEGFKEFSSLLSKLKSTKAPQEAIRCVLSFYKDYCYLSFDNPDERILDLEELAKMAANFPTIKKFLLDLSSYEEFKGETLLTAYDKDDILVLSTVHQSKGLEWNTVFIIGFSDYEFPHPKALNNEEGLEEERRLFYVAATRTKSLLYISYPQEKYTFRNGLIINRPSKFYYELSKDTYNDLRVEEFS